MTIVRAEDVDKLPSRRFRGFDVSDFEQVNQVIKRLFEEYLDWAYSDDGQKRIRQPEQIKEHLCCFILEVYRTYKINPKMAMAVSLGNETISKYKKSRYKPSHLTHRLLNHTVKFLYHRNYIEYPLGSKARATGAPSQQRSTRVKASLRLLELLDEFHVNEYMVSTREHECIVLRSEKRKGQDRGDDIQYEDTTFTLLARENLIRINEFISRHHINLEITDAQEQSLIERLATRNDGKPKGLDFIDTRLKRIFNNASFDQGGRFYGGFWQAIPKGYRAFVTINGNRTRQYDYSGMHFQIMYLKNEQPIPSGDVYSLESYDISLRTDIKKAFNIMINCESEKQAVAVINLDIRHGRLSEELRSGEELLARMKDKHPAIVNYIASGQGIYLQNIDSQIAEQIMLKGLENDICILPIHDGFICETKYESELQTIMNEAFYQVMGSKISIKPELIDLSLIDKRTIGIDPVVITESSEHVRYSNFKNQYALGFGSILSKENCIEEIQSKRGFINREALWDSIHPS